MTKQEAIKVLSDYQKWRKGDDSIKATEPKELTEAIEFALNFMKHSL